MSNDNQIEIPESFLNLFVERGRLKPNISRELVTSRYELCEDMACMLAEHAQALFNQGVCWEEILSRCHQGLMAESSVINEKESAWVIGRLSELLG